MIVNNIEGEMLYLHNKLFSAFLYTPDDLKRKKYHPFVRNMQRECKEL
jgi:hypothetical protein